MKPKIRSVRARSQISESNGDSRVVRCRPRGVVASAAGSAQAGLPQPVDRHRHQPRVRDHRVDLLAP